MTGSTVYRSDAELAAAVKEEIAWTPGLTHTRIGVAVHDGAITLSGEVDHYPEKRLAQRAALRVRGVTAVADEIRVRNTWAGVNDTDIAREAGEALDRSVNVPAGLVTAVVRDHVITLQGELPWHYQSEAAERAVRYLNGVADIGNEITIRPSASAAGIRRAITTALVRSAQEQGRGTTVGADPAGVVTLDGVVHSWTERRNAEDVAWSAPGVTDVINNIRIEN